MWDHKVKRRELGHQQGLSNMLGLAQRKQESLFLAKNFIMFNQTGEIAFLANDAGGTH